MRYPFLFATFILSISLACSFPLTGGNGYLNATVFGVLWGSSFGDNNLTDVYIDIALDTPSIESQSLCANYTAELLGENNKSYQRTEEICLGKRKLLGFKVSRNDVIKQLTLEGMNISMDSKPIIIISWDNPPEATADNLSLKFYDAKVSERYYDGWRDWYFDVELSNEGNKTQLVALRDFAMQDQYGWEYMSCNLICELLPNESMRFYIPIHFVSDLSRPTVLEYGDLSLDISGWT